MKKYVCVLSSNSYLDGLLVINECLKKNDSNYSLICLINEKISKKTINIIKNKNIDYKLINSLKGTYKDFYNPQWYYSFDKINVFNLIEYEKIVYLDLDLFLDKNIDELFDFDDLYMASDNPFTNGFNSGVMVIKPSNEDYVSMINLLEKNPNKYKGDQDIINEYFYGRIKELPIIYNSKRAIFFEKKRINNIKKHNVCIFNEEKKPKIIHYIGELKPFHVKDMFDDEYCNRYFKIINKIRRNME